MTTALQFARGWPNPISPSSEPASALPPPQATIYHGTIASLGQGLSRYAVRAGPRQTWACIQRAHGIKERNYIPLWGLSICTPPTLQLHLVYAGTVLLQVQFTQWQRLAALGFLQAGRGLQTREGADFSPVTLCPPTPSSCLNYR